jgi:hypothetical protein
METQSSLSSLSEADRKIETAIVQKRGMRKPGEPIYLRRHVVALVLAVGLPIIALQIYKIYVGPIHFLVQMCLAVLTSVVAGLWLYGAYRSSAQNEP